MNQSSEQLTQPTPIQKLLFLIPALRYEIWILALGRLLLGIGQGFTMVYASIFFVNQIGLSATQVGIAIGGGSISGVFARFAAGSFTDSQFWGRKGTALLSAATCALASICLALTYNFPTLVIGNLLFGFGFGLFWPPTEAMVADLTTTEQRNEGFAVTRLADSLGTGLGVILAGVFIAADGSYRALYVMKAISYLIFFVVIWLALTETYQPGETAKKTTQGWREALRDNSFSIWLVANILFTTYEASLSSIIPLYFANFVPGGDGEMGFNAETISILFFLNVAIGAAIQLPIARFLNAFSRIDALMFAFVIWGGGFSLIWLTGVVPSRAVIPAICAIAIIAIARVIHIPSAASLVGDLAPESLRGVYFALESQTWAAGYFIGPALGGWALDRSPEFAHNFWLIVASSVGLGVVILYFLGRRLSVTSDQSAVEG